MSKKINVGGQAVIEGVMMKSDSKIAIAVRTSKKIVTKVDKLKKGNKLSRLPFVRGVVNLYGMMVIGIKALMWSAEQSTEEEEEEIKPWELTLTFILSFVAVFGIFIGLPYFFTNLMGFNEETRPVLFNIVDGAMRISFFLAYIYGISFMKDVKTLFQYHGAEHKVIHCFEAGKALTIANVRKYKTLHPRCGTSFMIMVFFIAIVLFSVIPSIVMGLFPGFVSLGLIARKGILLSLRLIVVPVIAGISYEGLKLSDKFKAGKIVGFLIKPGLLMQKITTKEPTDKQIEVAITALKKVV